MKTHLKLIAVLFLAGFALLGQSCAEEEFPPRPGPAFPADVTNRYALLLQEQLQADGAAYDRYTEVLSDRTPVYEEVRFATHSAYGLCYIIPYCSPSGPTIEGAVYLPAGATCAEDGTVTFDGSLGTPIDIDAPTINRDIPFTERYTGYICTCLALFFISGFIRFPEYHILQFHAFLLYLLTHRTIVF